MHFGMVPAVTIPCGLAVKHETKFRLVNFLAKNVFIFDQARKREHTSASNEARNHRFRQSGNFLRNYCHRLPVSNCSRFVKGRFHCGLKAKITARDHLLSCPCREEKSKALSADFLGGRLTDILHVNTDCHDGMWLELLNWVYRINYASQRVLGGDRTNDCVTGRYPSPGSQMRSGNAGIERGFALRNLCDERSLSLRDYGVERDFVLGKSFGQCFVTRFNGLFDCGVAGLSKSFYLGSGIPRCSVHQPYLNNNGAGIKQSSERDKYTGKYKCLVVDRSMLPTLQKFHWFTILIGLSGCFRFSALVVGVVFYPPDTLALFGWRIASPEIPGSAMNQSSVERSEA